MLNIALWICQIFLVVVFVYSGWMKSTRTEKELVAMGQTGVENLPAGLIRFIGITEILGVLGIILPWLTGILPVLTPTAQISVAPDLLAEFAVEGKVPETVLIITVREAFVHCSRALVRSDLRKPEKHFSAANVSPMGTILAAHTKSKMNAEEYDKELPERVRQTLY